MKINFIENYLKIENCKLKIVKLKYLKVILALLILSSFLWLCIRVTDPDLGWHLRVGEEIFKTRTVPRTDHFSFTMAGTPWVDHEWLINAGLWWLEAHGLWWLAIRLFALIMSVPFFVWVWRARGVPEIGVVLLGVLYVDRLRRGTAADH